MTAYQSLGITYGTFGGGGGGSNTLSGLSDVTITSPLEGDHLIYNAVSGKWVNMVEAGDGDVVGPASSNDNSLTRFNGADGKHIQEAPGATLDDVNTIRLKAASDGASVSVHLQDDTGAVNLLSLTGNDSTGHGIIAAVNTLQATAKTFEATASNASTVSDILKLTNPVGSIGINLHGATPISAVTPVGRGSYIADSTTGDGYLARGLTNADWSKIHTDANFSSGTTLAFATYGDLTSTNWEALPSGIYFLSFTGIDISPTTANDTWPFEASATGNAYVASIDWVNSASPLMRQQTVHVYSNNDPANDSRWWTKAASSMTNLGDAHWQQIHDLDWATYGDPNGAAWEYLPTGSYFLVGTAAQLQASDWPYASDAADSASYKMEFSYTNQDHDDVFRQAFVIIAEDDDFLNGIQYSRQAQVYADLDTATWVENVALGYGTTIQSNPNGQVNYTANTTSLYGHGFLGNPQILPTASALSALSIEDLNRASQPWIQLEDTGAAPAKAGWFFGKTSPVGVLIPQNLGDIYLVGGVGSTPSLFQATGTTTFNDWHEFGSGSGFVTGPGSSTDRQFTYFNGTDGDDLGINPTVLATSPNNDFARLKSLVSISAAVTAIRIRDFADTKDAFIMGYEPGASAVNPEFKFTFGDSLPYYITEKYHRFEADGVNGNVMQWYQDSISEAHALFMDEGVPSHNSVNIGDKYVDMEDGDWYRALGFEASTWTKMLDETDIPGSNTQIIYNNGGVLGADAQLNYQSSNSRFNIGNGTGSQNDAGVLVIARALNSSAEGTFPNLFAAAHFVGSNSVHADVFMESLSTVASDASAIWLDRSRNKAAVLNGDTLGSIMWRGFPGSGTFHIAAAMHAEISPTGTVSGSSMPAGLIIETTRDGNTSPSFTAEFTSTGSMAYANTQITADADVGTYYTDVGDTSTVEITVTVPDDVISVVSNTFVITDTEGQAGSYPITIVGESGQTISGAASIEIDSNFGSVTLKSDGSNLFVIGKS